MAAEARESPIQKIENERAENVPNGGMKKIVRRIDIRALQQRAFQNFKRGSKSAKKISSRHEIRQEINLGRLVAHLIGEARDNCRSAIDVIADFYQYVRGERQIYFRSRTKANHSKAIAFLELISDIGPGDNAARDRTGQLPDH